MPWELCDGAPAALLRPDTARQTIAECAVREAAEETGLQLRNGTSQATCSTGHLLLAQPHPFTAADVIRRDPAGRIQYHYAIVEVRTDSRSCCSKRGSFTCVCPTRDLEKLFCVAGRSHATGPTPNSTGLCGRTRCPLGLSTRAGRHARYVMSHPVQLRSAPSAL